MPELPEVETTRRGITPYLVGRRIAAVIVRQRQLRWPVPPVLEQKMDGQIIKSVERRGKYLLLRTPTGTAILHLGMSGSLRILTRNQPAERHDHVDFVFDDNSCLRFQDPRRFGAVLWTETEPESHGLLRKLGPEPLGCRFSGNYLHQRAGGRRVAVKQFVMDGRIVVGVGNIYACESLFLAGIHPGRPAGRISLSRYCRLASAIKQTLEQAIACGGTTLRDFRDNDGQPGYFQQQLSVYGRHGEPCPQCNTPIRQIRQAQRTTFYCGRCQT